MRTTNRVRTEGARAFIPTNVTWNIPSDDATYVINVPIENYSDELNFEINHPDISVYIADFGKRGVQLSVAVANTVPDGLYNLIVISPGGITNENLQGVLAGNELSRVTVSAAPFSVTGDDTIDLYSSLQTAIALPIPVTKSSDATLNNEEVLVIAGANAIDITLPASPLVGAKHIIHANGFTIDVVANSGHNILGNAFITIEDDITVVLQYIGSNNWIIS